ncbi:peptidase U32 family protein [Candidatus Thiosymbion oneisti]|uniref:peptidase U32 family protein n=1 Tax=Candidatus Thiosymbion oneisti TaxID=589554 RepID=UPI000B7DFC62|nr:U32 family peptidase [Candidatus Thiosymbion oneisti]
MNRINIMAPTRSLEMSRYQCDARANELYLGLDSGAISEEFLNFTFNGRYNKMDGVSCQIDSVDDLHKVIRYIHGRGVKVNYTANIHYLSHDFQKEFDEYIEAGVDAGADYLIVSNLGIIQYLRKRGYTLPIVAGVFLVTPNVEQTKLLADLGVERVVLPQGVTLKEIAMFKEKSPLEIEMFGHFGGGNNCGRCMLLHSPTINDIGPGCRAAYDIIIEDEKEDEKNYFLDAAADCSLCTLPELMEAGIDVIKIVGRESNNSFVNSKITEFYKIFQDYALDGMTVPQIKKRFMNEELIWSSIWRPRFCEKKRCRFRPTNITKSYIV